MKPLQKIVSFLFLVLPLFLFSQNNKIEGTIVDVNNQPLSFVNVLLFENGEATPFIGTISDESGIFKIENLDPKEYFLEISMIGYHSVSKKILPSENNNLGIIQLKENIESLDETVINVKRPTIKKEVGKLVFNVENTSLSTGDSFNLLKKTPGVIVIGENISVKKTKPIIFINDKRVYLSASEVASLLKNLDASVIKSIEVITNPSAKYDAEAESVLNIITSKAVSIGYKGSVHTTYEQAVFSKYRLSTSQFYKNKWLNFYASYSFSPKKNYKQDDNFTRFFNTNNTTTKSKWKSDFKKVTRSKAHQGNMILDFTLNEKNSLIFSTTAIVSPHKTFANTIEGEIFDAQQQLDSVFNSVSNLEYNTTNLSFNVEHKVKLDEAGASLSTLVNYINYHNDQTQVLNTDYRLPSGMFLNNINFSTNAKQNSNIITGQVDFVKEFGKGNFETGIKYSNINTESGLDFFNIVNNEPEYVETNSDLFVYSESTFAGYVNYAKKWGKWNFSAGLRGEYTDVKGDSKSLGIINNQNYFDLFPTISALFEINNEHIFGINYSRSIERPRYQSLNPFSYFITDNITNNGNPNLVPTLKNKYLISYNLKNKWTFETYYIYKKNPLALLNFQNNENNSIQNIDTNIISDNNYSLDISYYSSLFSWWYLYAYTSGYYLENEFLAIASPQETYKNKTFGVYAQMYSSFNLLKDRTFTCDININYLSNMIMGSVSYKNQFNTSVSFRKKIWKKRASITLGVDDIFDTNNIPVTTNYYNQDNGYFAKNESRLFRLGFKYNFGNYRLKKHNRTKKIDEQKRLD